MGTYANNVEINGETFTHTVKAANYEEALQINAKRKIEADRRGRKIYGHLIKE